MDVDLEADDQPTPQIYSATIRCLVSGYAGQDLFGPNDTLQRAVTLKIDYPSQHARERPSHANAYASFNSPMRMASSWARSSAITSSISPSMNPGRLWRVRPIR